MVKLFSKIYFSLLILSPLVPRFDTADVIAADYVALNIVAIFGIIVLILKGTSDLNKNIRFKLPLLIFFSFFIISSLSIFFSINKTTSFVSLIKIALILVHLYLLYALKIYKVISLNYILHLGSFLFFVEVLYSSSPLYFEILPVRKYEYNFSQFLTGITGNRNITAASIVLKIPLILLLIYRLKNKYLKIFLSTLIIFGIINLFFLSSRAAILSLFLTITIYISIIFFDFLKEKNFNLLIKRIFSILTPVIISYIFFNANIVKNDRSSIQSRVSSISASDESATQRIRFYKQALKQFINSPFKPVGLANWKLYSIKLDKENINSYVIPYVVHNDFLEILVETSFIGFLAYSGFFMVILYFLYGLYFKQKEYNDKIEILLVGLAFLCYLVDANLNFPMYRPIMQVNLLLVTTVFLSYYNYFSNVKNI